MKIGGYQIIDLKGKNLTTDVGMVYEGIYELIEGTTKPILLSGIQVDDTEYQDVYVSVSINGSAFELKAYNKIFTIEDTDVVTVSNDNVENDGDNGGDEVPIEEYTQITIGFADPDMADSVGQSTYRVMKNKSWRENIMNGTISEVSTTAEGYTNFCLGNTEYIPNGFIRNRPLSVFVKTSITGLSDGYYPLYVNNTDVMVSETDIITGEDTYQNYMIV